MSTGVGAWLVHPVTLSLAGVGLALLFTVCESLLRSLAETGNVRFQGMLEDHPKLLPVNGGPSLHLSRVLDVLRWLQIGCVGLLWAVVFRMPGIDLWVAAALAVGLPLLLVMLARTVIGVLGEVAIAGLLRTVQPLVWPPLMVLARLNPAPQPPPPEDEEEEASEREIQAYVEAGHAAGIFEREEGEFVESLVDFFDTVVREVMTPRTEMVTVPDTASIDELLETIAETHKSRIPVYHETVDKVVGVVHVKNVVRQAMAEQRPPLTELMHECLVVPEAKELGELLRDFQRERQQLAIVVDEYGGTSGLVTLEDILEEIVGEIEDEHEPPQPPDCEEVASGVCRLQGRAPLELLGEQYGVDVDEDDLDTVGGLVFSLHGTVPEPGTEVVDEGRGLRFTVDEMDERRIVSVTVRRMENTGEPSDDAS